MRDKHSKRTLWRRVGLAGAVPVDGTAQHESDGVASPPLALRSRRTGPAWAVLCMIVGAGSFVGEMQLGPAAVALIIVGMCTVGIAVARVEFAAGLPVPATPGLLLWLGHFLAFAVGGALFWLLDVDPALGLETDALAWQLGVVTLGLSAFSVAYAFSVRSVAASSRRAVVQWPAVRLEDRALVVGCLALTLPVIGLLFAFPEYKIGSMRELGEPEVAPVVGVIIFGVLSFVRPVVLVLMGLYLIADGRKRIAVVALLAVVGFGHTFQATLAGGRTAILEAVLACLGVMAAFRLRQKRLSRVFFFAAVCALFVVWYVPTASQYRTQTGYGGASREVQTFSEYVRAFVDAGYSVMTDSRGIQDSLDKVVARLYEPSAFRVMATAREASEGFGFRGWGDLLFRWAPSFLREKGKDRDQDLMWQQGFKRHEHSGETLTLPADLYYRFGLVGVLLGYGVLGVLVGRITRWCWSGLNVTRFVALMALGVLVARIYAVDFVQAFWAPIYELPIGMTAGVLVFATLRESVGAKLVRLLRRSKHVSVG